MLSPSPIIRFIKALALLLLTSFFSFGALVAQDSLVSYVFEAVDPDHIKIRLFDEGTVFADRSGALSLEDVMTDQSAAFSQWKDAIWKKADTRRRGRRGACPIANP